MLSHVLKLSLSYGSRPEKILKLALKQDNLAISQKIRLSGVRVRASALSIGRQWFKPQLSHTKDY